MTDPIRLSRWSLVLAALGLTLGAMPLSSSAQISTDRPGFGVGAATVGAETFQAGVGYEFNEENDVRTHELGQLFVRYGLSDALELRGGINSYLVNESPIDNGYSGVDVGAKLRLLASELSTLSGVAMLTLPTQTVPNAPTRARQEVKLAFDGALGDGLTLSVNSGASFYYSAGVQDDRAVQWLFIPTLSVDVTDNVGAYVGYAGFYDDGPNANWVEGGMTFLSSLDTQFDVNTGLRVDDTGDAFFVGLGVAHRF